MEISGSRVLVQESGHGGLKLFCLFSGTLCKGPAVICIQNAPAGIDYQATVAVHTCGNHFPQASTLGTYSRYK